MEDSDTTAPFEHVARGFPLSLVVFLMTSGRSNFKPLNKSRQQVRMTKATRKCPGLFVGVTAMTTDLSKMSADSQQLPKSHRIGLVPVCFSRHLIFA